MEKNKIKTIVQTPRRSARNKAKCHLDCNVGSTSGTVSKSSVTENNENIPSNSQARPLKRKRPTEGPRTVNKNPNEQTTKKKASNRKPIAKKNLTIKERIDMEALDKCFVLNEIVLAVVPGYPAWPASVIDINGATITVQFFGTGERNPLRSHAISRFEFNKIVPLINRKGYKKAVRELEFVLGIPDEISLFSMH